MTYPDRLARELDRVGIRGRLARRIVLELEDHLASDSTAAERLGEPALVAGRFAAELVTVRARRAAVTSFLVLAAIGLALLAPPLAIEHAGGYPDVFAGHSAALAGVSGLLLFVAPQLSFVAGSLALLRALRLRRAPVLPAAEARVIERRAAVGLGTAVAAALGVALYAVNFAPLLPAWWTALALACAAASVPLAAAGAVTVRRAAAVVSTATGAVGDLADDLPPLRPLRDRPWLLAAAVGIPVTLAAFAVGWAEEGAPGDGLVRAVPEAFAFAVCFAAMRRFLALTRA